VTKVVKKLRDAWPRPAPTGRRNGVLMVKPRHLRLASNTSTTSSGPVLRAWNVFERTDFTARWRTKTAKNSVNTSRNSNVMSSGFEEQRARLPGPRSSQSPSGHRRPQGNRGVSDTVAVGVDQTGSVLGGAPQECGGPTRQIENRLRAVREAAPLSVAAPHLLSLGLRAYPLFSARLLPEPVGSRGFTRTEGFFTGKPKGPFTL